MTKKTNDTLPFFPLFTDISRWNVLVVGAGEIALRRLQTLSQFTRQITVVAPVIHPDIACLAKTNNWTVKIKPYEESDLAEARMVLAVTNQRQVNHRIYRDCKRGGNFIYVNVADRQEECDFLFPGVVQKGQQILGVTSGGKDKTGTKNMIKKLKKVL